MLQRRERSISSQRLPFQIAVLGGSKILAAWMNVCLKTIHQLTHGSNAAGHHCVCMNTSFSLTPGCFRFLGFLFCLFVCFWGSWLTSYKASIHIGVCEAVIGQNVAWSPLPPHEQLSESHRTRGRARGKAPLREKSAGLLRSANVGVFLAFFFFPSVIVRAWISQEITKGIYFYFKIGKTAHLFNKKLVLPVARCLSLSRLPLMTNYTNSG